MSSHYLSYMTMRSLRSWTLELGALMISLSVFSALVVLLALFDGKSAFRWKWVNLNTVIAMLSITMKAFLIFSVTECVGQWKWILFSQKERPLVEFERIDLASRGPLGAISVVWRAATPWKLRLGVGIIILAIVVDPFTQQLVQLHQDVHVVDKVNGTRATIPWAREYNRGTLIFGYEKHPVIDARKEMAALLFANPDVSMHAAILEAILTPKDIIKQQIRAFCPGIRCEWPQYQTVGVCHKCTNVAPKLRKKEGFGIYFNDTYSKHEEESEKDVTALVLPNGQFIANFNGCPAQTTSRKCRSLNSKNPESQSRNFQMTSLSTSDPDKTIEMGGIQTLIVSMSIIRKDLRTLRRMERDWQASRSSDHLPQRIIEDENDHSWAYWPNNPMEAEECALYYCVKSVQSRVEEGILHEEITEVIEYSRDPGSWQPINRTEGINHVVEAVPKSKDGLYSLEFDTRYSAVLMKPLVLRMPDEGSQSYTIGDKAVKAINAYFKNTLGMLDYPRADIQNLVGPDHVAVEFNRQSDGEWTTPKLLGNIVADENVGLSEVFERLAVAMTNNMRSSGGNSFLAASVTGNATQLPDRDIYKYGTVALPITVHVIKWSWITIHVLLLLGGLSFCSLTIAISTCRSSSVPAFKSSALATMSQSFLAASMLAGAETLPELTRRAKNGSIMLVVADRDEILPL